MVVLALILLVLVAVLVVAIVVSNPEIYDLSIFGAIVPVNSAGIFITGAIAMAVTILAILLLRMGIRRGRARRTERKVLLQAAGDKLPGSASATETATTTSKTSGTSATSDPGTEPTTSKTSDTSATSDSRTTEPTTPKEKSSLDLEGGDSSTTWAERQAMLDEADALTKDEAQK